MYVHSFRTPPSLPGSYIIRNSDGDIIYWGDTPNLYEAWCAKVDDRFSADHNTFEYELNDMSHVRFIYQKEEK
jgi:hypothetical protein